MKILHKNIPKNPIDHKKNIEIQIKKINENIQWIMQSSDINVIVIVIADFKNFINNYQSLILRLGQQNTMIDKLFDILTIFCQKSKYLDNIFYDSNQFLAEKQIIKNIQEILLLLECDTNLFDVIDMDTTYDEMLAETIFGLDD